MGLLQLFVARWWKCSFFQCKCLLFLLFLIQTVTFQAKSESNWWRFHLSKKKKNVKLEKKLPLHSHIVWQLTTHFILHHNRYGIISWKNTNFQTNLCYDDRYYSYESSSFCSEWIFLIMCTIIFLTISSQLLCLHLYFSWTTFFAVTATSNANPALSLFSVCFSLVLKLFSDIVLCYPLVMSLIYQFHEMAISNPWKALNILWFSIQWT